MNDTAELGDDEEEEQAPSREGRRLRQEESRLGAYVVGALEDLYQSESAPADTSYVFGVHKERAGSEYENIDVLAVHWRSERVVELISVEIKLKFSARLVQQVWNYTRFSDRVWIAVPVLADATNVAQALREYDPLLFEHVIAAGLGIVACRRRPGKSYEVIPVEWPQRLQPDPITKEVFLETISLAARSSPSAGAAEGISIRCEGVIAERPGPFQTACLILYSRGACGRIRVRFKIARSDPFPPFGADLWELSEAPLLQYCVPRS